MAIFNHMLANERTERAKKFEELKAFISSVDEEQKINSWFPAYLHICEMEAQMKRQSEDLERYRKFFSQLNALIPKEATRYDRVG